MALDFCHREGCSLQEIVEKKYNYEWGGWCLRVGWGHYSVCCGRIFERVGANFPDSSILRLVVLLLIKKEEGW